MIKNYDKINSTYVKDSEAQCDLVVEYLSKIGVKAIEYKDSYFTYETQTVKYDCLSLLLHEAGHAVLQHKPQFFESKIIRSDEEQFQIEIEAWEKAVEIMNELKISDCNFKINLKECLETYQ